MTAFVNLVLREVAGFRATENGGTILIGVDSSLRVGLRLCSMNRGLVR